MGSGFFATDAFFDFGADGGQRGGWTEVFGNDTDDGEAVGVLERAEEFVFFGFEEDGGELGRKVFAGDVILNASFAGVGVLGVCFGEFGEGGSCFELFGDFLGFGELLLWGGSEIILIESGDENFLEGDGVFGFIAEIGFDFVVFALNFGGEWRSSVGEVLGAHALDDEFIAGHFAVAVHGEAGVFELFLEFGLVAVVELVDLTFDFLIDELGLKFRAHLFEFRENDFAVDELVDDFGASFEEAFFEFGAAARELGAELCVHGSQEEHDLAFGDDASVDFGGHAVDFNGFGESRGGDGAE